jgi:predicted DNA-binding antitoxin AbrB/MazE fold protein
MIYHVKAVYENGVLKLEQPLPLPEHEPVRVVVRVGPSHADKLYGMVKWTGDPSVLEQVAEDPEHGILGSP